MDSEELFAKKLTQLEMGYPLDEVVADLPEQEARLLRLAASLPETPFPTEEDAAVAAQRAWLLTAAKEITMTQPSTSKAETKSLNILAALTRFLTWLGTQVDGVLRRRDLAVGLGAALLIVLLVGGVWLYRSQDSRPSPRAERDDSGQVAEMAAEDELDVAAVVDEGKERDGTETAVSPSATEPGYQLFLPTTVLGLQVNAETAVLQVVHGLVEQQAADGSWTILPQQTTLTAGQRIRTGPLSLATLTFYDGSQAALSANSELSIDQLNAQRPEEGLRTVVMTQFVGESDHNVQFRGDGGSRYEVNTPAGSGLARGTQFKVVVTPGLLAQFIVSEGRVDVTGLNQVVDVVAGQVTAVLAGSPPQAPAFRIFGEGEVGQIGAVWTIGGQTFQTTNQTIIVGNPQVGDLVRVEGRLLDDGSRQADRIVLQRRAVANRFTLTGEVNEMNPTVWTVAGQTLLVDAQTRIDQGIAVGDAVQVAGAIVAGGALRAERIERLDGQPGQPFRFTGLVEIKSSDLWTISGVAIALDANTVQDDDLAVGDLVMVDGRILPNGTWLARRIMRAAEELPEFTFTGRVQSIEPWRVAGLTFETREWTAVEPGISQGDRVRVRGVILTDGTWVASSIERLNRSGGDDDDDADDGRGDDDYNTIVLVGVVSSIDPWIVNGLQLFLTDDSRLQGNIRLGELVQVRIRLAGNGMWQVVAIRPLTPRFGLGCFVINTTFLGLQSNQLLLQHWPALSLDDDDDDFADLLGTRINSVVAFPLCIAFDGTIVITGRIIVIYQPIVIVVPQPPQPPRGNGNFNNNRNNNG